jgi:hypothetical protein
MSGKDKETSLTAAVAKLKDRGAGHEGEAPYGEKV